MTTMSMILAWGSNSDGQCCEEDPEVTLLHRPGFISHSIARELGAATKVTYVATGDAHSLLLTSHGHVFACGRAREGQLGLDSEVLQNAGCGEVRKLMPVESLRNWGIRRIACGSKHSTAVTSCGKAFEWGLLIPFDRNSDDSAYFSKRSGCGKDFQEDLTERQRRIVAASWNAYLNNSRGKLQKEDYSANISAAEVNRIHEHLPRRCIFLGDDEVPKVCSAASGYAHTVIATEGGALWAAGYGEKGQLGSGKRFSSAKYGKVPLPHDITAARAGIVDDTNASNVEAQLACGLNHTAAVMQPGGALMTWGLGVFGQLGLGHLVKESCSPDIVQISGEILQVACGEHHTIALTAAGDVFTFGHRDAVGGQSHDVRRPERQQELSSSEGVNLISAGGMGCFAVVSKSIGPQTKAEESLNAWGYNQRCQLGRQSSALRPGPVAIPQIPGSEIKVVAPGAGHCLTIVSLGVCAPAVLPSEFPDVSFLCGSSSLLAAFEGKAPYDVVIHCGSKDHDEKLGVHHVILRTRCKALASRCAESKALSSLLEDEHRWELDLRPYSKNCVKALLEYLYTDFCRASVTLAGELIKLAKELAIPRLAAGASGASVTHSEEEGQRWVRSSEGKWIQASLEDAGNEQKKECSTFAQDVRELVRDVTDLKDKHRHASVLEDGFGDVIELRVQQDDGKTRILHAARCLLITIDFLRALLEGGFAEAQQLREAGPRASVEVRVDDCNAFSLCLRLLCISGVDGMEDLLSREASSAWQLLAVLSQAHRLELWEVVSTVEELLCRSSVAEVQSAMSKEGSTKDQSKLVQALLNAAELFGVPRLAEVVQNSAC